MKLAAAASVLLATLLAPAKQEAPRRIAIIAPMAIELEPLLAEAEITERRTIAKQVHHLGVLGGREVVLVRCGRSLVAAARAAQAAIDHHAPAAIVVVGIAGGVNPKLGIAEVVVPGRWGLYQEHVVAREGPDGYEPGYRRRGSRFEGFGVFVPRPQRLTYVEDEAEVDESRFWFDADERLLAAARRAARGTELARCTKRGDCVDATPAIHVAGHGVSGNGFVDNSRYREWIWETFEAHAVDQETAAIAQVAYGNDVPYIAFRGLSDLAGGHDGANRARTFAPLAAANAAAAVVAFLEALLPV